MSVDQTNVLLFGGIATIASYVIAFFSRHFARRFNAVDQPTGGRKIHERPIPLFGGLGIGLVMIVCVLTVVSFSISYGRNISSEQLIGFVVGAGILVIGGLLDDLFDLNPRVQIIFPIFASISVVLSGTNVDFITNWTGGAPISLGWVSGPITFAWLLLVTYAMKFLDGLDGLVTGQTIIGASLLVLLSLATPYYHPTVAVLAAIVAGAYLGFLPHNFHPAKQFLGESGSTLAGFALGFLSIIGGAKLATGLMALGFPLVDASVVILGRLAHGRSPFRGDNTHLHFKLLRSGLSQRKTVLLLWALSLGFGIAAFGLQTKGKIILLLVLALVTAVASYTMSDERRAMNVKP